MLTASEEEAVYIRGLLQAEAALRELLAEASRKAEVVAAGSDAEAARIADAIRDDEALRPFAPALEVVVVQ